MSTADYHLRERPPSLLELAADWRVPPRLIRQVAAELEIRTTQHGDLRSWDDHAALEAYLRDLAKEASRG